MVKPLSLDELAVYYTIPSLDRLNNAHTYFRSGTSLFYSFREDAYNQISPHIYLGKLPSPAVFDLPTEVKMVISMSTYEELIASVTPAQWQERGIEHVLLHIPDYTANVSTRDAINVINKMHELITRDPAAKVYLHCHLGHSRSVMICAAYLALYGDAQNFKSIQSVIEYISTKRRFASVDASKMNKAEEIRLTHQASPLQRRVFELPTFPDTASYLRTLDAKDKIRQLVSFKEIAIYAAKIRKMNSVSSGAANYVQQFFHEIHQADNASWYDNLLANRGPLYSLLSMKELSLDESKKWRDMIGSFIAEVKGLLTEFVMTPDEEMTMAMRRLFA